MNCKIRRLKLLRTGYLSDCQLDICFVDLTKRIRCRRKFYCHRVILASASKEFERLINAPEFVQNNRIIYLTDASPDAYETLLLYIYTYEVNATVVMEMCPELLYLAKKHEMYDLVDCYIKKLASRNWPIEIVLQIFQLANESESESMMEIVAEKIVPCATEVLRNNSFVRLTLPELKALISIIKSKEILPNEELLQALKNYQISNNLYYNKMIEFQQFTKIVQNCGTVLFTIDGALVLNNERDSNKRNRTNDSDDKNDTRVSNDKINMNEVKDTEDLNDKKDTKDTNDWNNTNVK